MCSSDLMPLFPKNPVRGLWETYHLFRRIGTDDVRPPSLAAPSMTCLLSLPLETMNPAAADAAHDVVIEGYAFHFDTAASNNCTMVMGRKVAAIRTLLARQLEHDRRAHGATTDASVTVAPSAFGRYTYFTTEQEQGVRTLGLTVRAKRTETKPGRVDVAKRSMEASKTAIQRLSRSAHTVRDHGRDAIVTRSKGTKCIFETTATALPVVDQILKKRKKIIINKRTLEILVVTKVADLVVTKVVEEILAVVQVVVVELTLVVERILQVELDKALVDLEMVMAQDKELDKV